MPKSYDDPPDRIELLRMAREAKEKAAEKHARRSRPDYERTDPPPRQEWPPKPIQGGGGYSSPPPPPRTPRPSWRERHPRGWGTAKEIIGAATLVCGTIVSAVLWVNSRASKDDISSLTHRMDPMCLPPESDGKKPLPPSLTERLDALKAAIELGDQRVLAEQGAINKRLDKWDEILLPQYSARGAPPPPPALGPAAKAKGRP
jgi:hypothetical protein